MILDMIKSNKERLKEEIEYVVENAVKKNTFSGAGISFYKREGNFEWSENFSFGKTSKFKSGKKVCNDTYFDLASLTKPLVTALSAAVLIERGDIGLQDKLLDCCDWFIPADKVNIRISHLLSHSSGLPAHRPYHMDLSSIQLLKKKEKIISWVIGEELEFLPGTKTVYSDLGYILLGFLIEEITGESLESFWRENIASHLGLNKFLFFLPKRKMDSGLYVATRNCKEGEDLLSGVVHDYNCRAMGGVAGHAGLFGTAPAVLSLCKHLIAQYTKREKPPSYSSSLLVELLKKRENLNWACGFDTPAEINSSSGLYFSDTSRGHLGFTGTSFWIDFDKQIAIVVLTNRVHMSNDIKGIRTFRPLIHNTIMKEICNI